MTLALLLHIGAVVAMLYTYLSATPEPDKLPETAKSEITFGGEYVQLGDIPVPDLDAGGIPEEGTDDPASDGSDPEPEGTPGEGESLVSSNQPSPATTSSRRNGPTEAEKREQERIRKEKEAQEKERRSINSRTSNAFSRANNGGGTSGSPDGNSTTGALQGTPGHNLGKAYKLQVRRPSCSKSGEIRISVLVRSDGTIAEAKYAGGTGAAASDRAIRKQFENFTKSLRFTVTGEVPATQRGTITWQIK